MLLSGLKFGKKLLFNGIYIMEEMICQFCGQSTERVEEDYRVGCSHLQCYLEVQLSTD